MAIWSLRVLQLIPQVFLLPFLIHRIGKDLFGIYVLAWSFVPIFDLLQAGIASGVVKYSAEYHEKKQIGQINRILSTSCLMTGSLGFLGGLFIVVIINFIPGLLQNISEHNPEQLRLACNSIALMIIVSFPLMPYSGILHSLQRYDIFSLTKVAFDYLRVGIIVIWFLVWGPSFEVLVLVSAVSYLLLNICLTLTAYNKMPGLKCDFRLCNLKTFRLLMGFGVMVFFRNFCMVINKSGVTWMSGILISPGFVGVLAIIKKPAELMKQTIQAMSVSIMPATSKYCAQGNQTILRELFLRGTRYMTAALTVGMIMVALLAQPIMKLWMGPEYEYLYPYVITLCLGMSIWMSTDSAGRMLEGMGMLRARLISSFVGPVLITIPLILILLLVFDLGYWAIVLGLVAGYMVETVMRIIYLIRKTSLKLRTFFWYAYGQGLIIMIPLMCLLEWVIYYYDLRSLLVRVPIAFLSLSVYIVLFMLFWATKAEKAMIGNIFNLVRSRIIKLVLRSC